MNIKKILIMLLLVIVLSNMTMGFVSAKRSINVDKKGITYHTGEKHLNLKSTEANCYWGELNVKCHYYKKTVLPYYVNHDKVKYVKIKIGSKTIKKDSRYMFYAYSGNLKGKTVKITAYDKYNKALLSTTFKVKTVKTGYNYAAN